MTAFRILLYFLFLITLNSNPAFSQTPDSTQQNRSSKWDNIQPSNAAPTTKES